MNDTILILLQHIAEGEASGSEKKQILDWLNLSEENRLFYADFMASYNLHDTLSSDCFELSCDDMLSRLNSRIDAYENRSRTGRPALWLVTPVCIALAACLALLLFLFPGRRQSPADENSSSLYCCVNNSLGIKSVILSDGTKVFLKPGAEIEYNVSRLPDERIINLMGEAYFDVMKDSLRPMVVNASGLGIKVLGTAFTVRNIPGDNDIEVVLEHGLVRLYSETGTPLVRLSPNQKATYSASDGDLHIEHIRAFPYVIETFNLESLENVTASQIISYLESLFNVRLRAEIKNPDKTYYFSFLQSNGLQEALQIFEHLTGVKPTIINNNQSTN